MFILRTGQPANISSAMLYYILGKIMGEKQNIPQGI